MPYWVISRPHVICLLAITASGCATTAPRSELLRTVGRSDMSEQELRIRVRALAARFSGLLEAMADDIAERGDDLHTRRVTTQFKTNAIPAMQAAIFQPDPVAALVDAWAMLAQLEPALARRLEREDLVAVGRAQLRVMEDEVEDLWRILVGSEDVATARERVHEWAREHPLTESLAARESTAGLFAELTAGSDITALSAAAEIVVQTADLATRLDVLAATLPKQGRWQAEYLLLGLSTEPALRTALADLGGLIEAIEGATRIFGIYPTVVAREREALLAALHDESSRLQRALSGERLAAFEQLRSERIAVLAEMDRLARGWIDRAFEHTTTLVDRLFVRLVVLVALLVIGSALAALMIGAALRRDTRRPSDRG